MSLLQQRRPRRDTRALSPAVAAQASAARKRSSIICRGISMGELVTIHPKDFDRLDVDRTYQRDRINQRVNDLIDAMQGGGEVLDPVTLVKRKFAQPLIDPKKLWIIDGQQRVYAFISLNRPFQAMLHESDSIDAEADFFLAMDNRTKISASVVVHTWPGHAGKIIRSAAIDPNHPLYGRIDFKGKKGGYRASVLAQAVASTVGASDRGQTQEVLSKIDHEVARDSHNIAKSKSILTLIPAIFQGTSDSAHQPAVALKALGAVARQKWQGAGNAPHPCRKCVFNIQRMNWTQWAPTNNERFRGMLELEIGKRWKC